MLEETQSSTLVAFQSYGRPLYMVTVFKYLGRVLTASYDDCPEVVKNLYKNRSRWAQFYIILVWEGEDTQTSRIF